MAFYLNDLLVQTIPLKFPLFDPIVVFLLELNTVIIRFAFYESLGPSLSYLYYRSIVQDHEFLN